MEARDLEALKATINQSASTASDAVLKEARALREQLKERELKAKKQLKREAEAARVREAREASARHALQALLDASGRDALREALAQAEALVEDFSELLFDAMVAGNERLQELDQELAQESRAAAAAAPPQQVLTLANAGDITGRNDAPESTIGGETTCIVCMARPKTHLAVPCAHQCACGPCAGKMQLCPYCRAPVERWFEVRVV